MSHKISLQEGAALLLVLLVAVGVSLLLLNNPPVLGLDLVLRNEPVSAANVEAFDYGQAAENSAYRWQAMARFYEEHGLLTRDNFDYEQAAENSAYRWQAMARFYEEHGLLTRDNVGDE